MIELLLKHRSAVSPADSAGQTPLHHAIAEGHGDAALALLKAGAEADRKDVDGKTPMELAPDKKVCVLGLLNMFDLECEGKLDGKLTWCRCRCTSRKRPSRRVLSCNS